jgi:hypothetical protein
MTSDAVSPHWVQAQAALGVPPWPGPSGPAGGPVRPLDAHTPLGLSQAPQRARQPRSCRECPWQPQSVPLAQHPDARPLRSRSACMAMICTMHVGKPSQQAGMHVRLGQVPPLRASRLPPLPCPRPATARARGGSMLGPAARAPQGRCPPPSAARVCWRRLQGLLHDQSPASSIASGCCCPYPEITGSCNIRGH